MVSVFCITIEFGESIIEGVIDLKSIVQATPSQDPKDGFCCTCGTANHKYS